MPRNSSSSEAVRAARCGASGKLANAAGGLFRGTEGRLCALAGQRYSPLVVVRPPRGLCLASKRAKPVKCFRINEKCSNRAGYGVTGEFGGFKCHSSAKGLRCENRDNHGFFLLRATIYFLIKLSGLNIKQAVKTISAIQRPLGKNPSVHCHNAPPSLALFCHSLSHIERQKSDISRSEM